MKKTFLVGLLAVLAAAGMALAQDAPKSPRVAVIDMARVSAESLLGKSYAAQLEKLQNDINAEATKKQTELGKMDAAVKALQDELEKQGAVLSQEARDRKQQEIVRKGRERQAFLEDGQAEINRMRERAQQQAQSINNEFQLKVRPIVEQVAKDKGYDLVLDSQVAYTINKDYDITRDVIVKADEAEKSKPAASAAPAPAAPPPPANPKPQANPKP
jgi:outer membrane protein